MFRSSGVSKENVEGKSSGNLYFKQKKLRKTIFVTTLVTFFNDVIIDRPLSNCEKKTMKHLTNGIHYGCVNLIIHTKSKALLEDDTKLIRVTKVRSLIK